MRTLSNITKTLVIAATFFAFASCSSDDDNPTQQPIIPYVPASSVKAKVNGTNFTSINAVANIIGSSNGAGNLITITGATMFANTIVIAVDKVNGTGTYNINPGAGDDASVLAYYDNSAGKSYDTSDCGGATGTVTITLLTETKVEGRFSFIGKDDENCSDQRTVTEGTFTATLPAN